MILALGQNLISGSFTDGKTHITNYYYYFNSSADSEDDTYYLVLKNRNTGQYGAVTSFTLNHEQMWKYSEQLDNDNNAVNSRFDSLINYLKDRFGFILYPFELVFDIFDRFYNIDWSEPILKIPSLSVPLYGQKLTDEIIYNFNDMLSNSIVKYIHDIYLIFVDVIVIYKVVVFGMSIFEEVFTNG